MRAVTYVEIDVPDFVTDEGEETFRFAKPTLGLPKDIEAIPSILSVDYTPSEISLGKDLGKRAALDVTFRDHRHVFDTEPFDQGSFWGKWRARYGLRIIGNSLRWVQGFAHQALEDMTTRHFVIENASGPSLSGTYSLTAKDVLKLADDDRAQAPKISKGFLASAIDETATSVVLSPTGIGAEYPTSGWVALGGEEIAAYTRTGDTLTLTRGDLGTSAVAHDAGVRAQLVLRYSGEDPADIIRDLLVTYASIPSEYINLDAWKSETENFLQRQYTATIADPVPVRDLVSELIEQAALAIWWDEVLKRIRLQVLRSISTDAARFTPDNILAGSFDVIEQPDKRVSQVWVYFGQRNPLEPVDEPNNYSSVSVTADLEAEEEYGRPAIRKIFSRWIPFGGRVIAERVGEIQLARYVDPPRKVAFSVFRGGEVTPVLGGGYRLEAWPIQNTDGTAADMPIQVTRIKPGEGVIQVQAEEMLFQAEPIDLVNRVIIIDADVVAVNLRTLHDQIYPEPTGLENPPINVTAIVEEAVTVGSTGVDTPAFDVGDWPAGIDLTLKNRGIILGAGGKGGTGSRFNSSARNGKPGGTALYTRVAIDLENTGNIAGGGGGGGAGVAFENGDLRAGGGGGGGAGVPGGVGGPHDKGGTGQDGTKLKGGDGGVRGTLTPADGGNGYGVAGEDGESRGGGGGGGPGAAGGDGSGNAAGSGGNPGTAIDGVSYVTKVIAGNIWGPEVN